MTQNIEFGVSLYGFMERYVKDDTYGWEEMFQELNRMGVKKIEVVGATHFETYPHVTDAEIAKFNELAEKYDVHPYSYYGHIDFAKRSDRNLTDAEIIAELTFNLMTAHKLHCEFVNAFGIPVRLYPEVAQMAAYYKTKVVYEIHSPQKPSDPDVQELAKIFDELNSPWVGFLQDFGCFIERPNELHINRFLGLGAKKENLQFIIDNRRNGYTEETMAKKMEEMGGGEAEKMAVSEWFGYASFAPADLEGFKSILKHCKYFHAKFYHISESGIETTIPYETLIKMIVDSGFSGTIMIEYEGHSFYLDDAVEQISRHLEMDKKIMASMQ